MSETEKNKTYEPKSDLSKLLLVLVQEVAAIAPRAFINTNVENAFRIADASERLEGEGEKTNTKGLNNGTVI